MPRKSPHQRFVEYMHFIANHENYHGMPDLMKDDGEIQWETPSNRLSGKHKDSHQKRLDWWRKKATEVGINPNSAEWISRTAKLIHPTKNKPCSVCGNIMELRYVYPSGLLISRIRKLSYINDSFTLDPNEHINELMNRLIETYGPRVYSDIPKILKTKHLIPPELRPTIDDWLKWINEVYIPSQPNTLSPGAMSNAPDRLDGFHTYNRCCRPQEDTGRTPENLRTYATDRRVFEFWNQGDWIAADRLVGQVRSKFRNETCRNGHAGPCDADHIGPLSLGFNHRPEFQLLCSACNSSKNNRMTLNDVQHLKIVEANGEEVISWHSKALWDKCKGEVVNEETALRLSKLLRDNRHTVMNILKRMLENGHYVFLATYLELDYANWNVNFENLGIEDHMIYFDRLTRVHRGTKYSYEQKARRCRIAFESLVEYFQKQTRNTYIVSTEATETQIALALCELGNSPDTVLLLNERIGELLGNGNEDYVDNEFRKIVDFIPSKLFEPPCFIRAKIHLIEVMRLVAEELSRLWNDDRYVRASEDVSED